jgi:hypothetical protein
MPWRLYRTSATGASNGAASDVVRPMREGRLNGGRAVTFNRYTATGREEARIRQCARILFCSKPIDEAVFRDGGAAGRMIWYLAGVSQD